MSNTVSIHNRDQYTTSIETNGHTLTADEPLDLGGSDKGPTPKDLLLSSLGSCKAITMRMYANRKEWPLEDIQIDLALDNPEDNSDQTTYIKVKIKLIGNLDDKQRERLIKISEKCPIHKILTNNTNISTQLL